MVDNTGSLVKRRNVVATTGVVLSTALAGCSDNGDQSDGTADNGDQSDNGDMQTDEDSGSEETAQFIGETTISWPRELAGTYRNQYVPEASGAPAALEQFHPGEFEFDIPVGQPLQSVHHEGSIYVREDDVIHKFDSEGEKLWDREEDLSPIDNSPFVTADGEIYCVSDNDQFIALDPDSGDRRWIRGLPGEWELDEYAFQNGIFYTVDDDFSEYEIGAYDVEAESFSWDASVDRSANAVHVHDEYLIVRESDSFYSGIKVFDRSTGDEQFEEELDSQPNDFIGNETTVLAVRTGGPTRDSFLIAYDLSDWSRKFTESSFDGSEPFAADNRHFYYWDETAYVAADAATGEEEWTYPMTDSPSGVLVTDDVLYLTQGERIYTVDADSGEELLEHDAEIDDLSELGELTLSDDRLWATAYREFDDELLVGFDLVENE